MQSSASPFLPAAGAAPDAAHAVLRHFPAEVRDAYTRFLETRQPADADLVVLAVVWDHVADKASHPTQAVDDHLSLIADLGFDSVAITEMVFFLEDLFRMKISNDEILRVRTVGDLRAFVRAKLDPAKPTGEA